MALDGNSGKTEFFTNSTTGDFRKFLSTERSQGMVIEREYSWILRLINVGFDCCSIEVSSEQCIRLRFVGGTL